MKLEGIFLSVPTPFDHSGDLYGTKFSHNFEKWNLVAASGYVVCGRAGESALLTSDEKVTLWKWAAEYASPGKILIAGVCAESVRETVLLCNRAAAAGCRAALLETPRLATTAAAQTLYFRTVADQSRIPLIRPDPPSWATSAAALWSSLAAGADGAVLDYAAAAPYSAIAIWEAHRKRDAETGQDWQNRVLSAALVTEKYGVPGLKYAMDLNGYYGGPCRLPLLPLTNEAKREIEAAFRDLRG
jgi:4-hydroxy-2-oxoglutarate aldolase